MSKRTTSWVLTAVITFCVGGWGVSVPAATSQQTGSPFGIVWTVKNHREQRSQVRSTHPRESGTELTNSHTDRAFDSLWSWSLYNRPPPSTSSLS